MKQEFFKPAEILIPHSRLNRTKFSVVACDQYTSELDYWNRTQQFVGDSPSAYHLTFPEIYLENDDFDQRISSINRNMADYLDKDYFSESKDSLIYVERTLKNGQIRKGIVGTVDLEQYDYTKGSQGLIRATEGTVLERIPPRVKIRENALLELPHIMLLVDDDSFSVIEPLATEKDKLEQLYDFDLMENSGHITGYRIDNSYAEKINAVLKAMSDKDYFNVKYELQDKPPMLFAVGDGNHSLATAKACYETIKKSMPLAKALAHPARYALVELVNLHDPSLTFEAIHRIIFHVDPEHMLTKLRQKYETKETPDSSSQTFQYVTSEGSGTISIKNSNFNLTVGTLQDFLDEYLYEYDGKIDYIHGEDVVRSLCKERGNIGFILPCMGKSDLFKTVIVDGALPRKTFSMGEACDKRFYLEARRIKP